VHEEDTKAFPKTFNNAVVTGGFSAFRAIFLALPSCLFFALFLEC
jgi:hypothetical protein